MKITAVLLRLVTLVALVVTGLPVSALASMPADCTMPCCKPAVVESHACCEPPVLISTFATQACDCTLSVPPRDNPTRNAVQIMEAPLCLTPTVAVPAVSTIALPEANFALPCVLPLHHPPGRANADRAPPAHKLAAETV